MIPSLREREETRQSYRELKQGKKSTGIKYILLCLLLLAAGLYSGNIHGETIGYNQGYDQGYNIGNEEGLTEGYESGYNDGKEYGWDSGWTSGNQQGAETGYKTGYTEGQETGYVEGYSEGETTGYDTGYLEGFTIGFQETGYQTRDPTYSEMKTFLRRDKTDENRYVPITYDCDDFAADVKKNAYNQGIRCFLVLMEFKGGSGHAVVSFNTKDQGMIFIEPQSDEVITVKLGATMFSKEIVSFDVIP
jgi:hypothetical protein